MKKMMTEAMDDAMDRKAGVRENSTRDLRMDAKAGVAQDGPQPVPKGGSARSKTAVMNGMNAGAPPASLSAMSSGMSKAKGMIRTAAKNGY